MKVGDRVRVLPRYAENAIGDDGGVVGLQGIILGEPRFERDIYYEVELDTKHMAPWLFTEDELELVV